MHKSDRKKISGYFLLQTYIFAKSKGGSGPLGPLCRSAYEVTIMTMHAKVTRSSTLKKINFRLNTRVIAQNDRLTELNNYYIKIYGLK